jgi:hypothetical protein
MRHVLCLKSSSGSRPWLWTVRWFQTATVSVPTSAAHPAEAIRPAACATRLHSACPLGKGSGINGWIVTAATAAIRM